MAAKKSSTNKKMEESTPPVTETPKKTNTKKTSTKTTDTPSMTKEKVTTPVETTTEVDTTLTENVALTTDTVQLTENFTEFMTRFQSLFSQMSSLKNDFKVLEKKAIRTIKLAEKDKAKRKRKTGNRSPSGFVKPTLISPELAKFLQKPVGTEMARTEVTREINGYIRQHALQDKDNGRKINPDKALAGLLKIKSGDELTYFNLQRYMSPHFAKASGSSSTMSTVAVTA